MDGVDYGGVEVKSFGFENSKVVLMQKHGLQVSGTHMMKHTKMKYLDLMVALRKLRCSKVQKMALNTMYIKIMCALMILIGTAAQQLLIQMQ